MAEFCLPPEQTERFKQAIRDGVIDPARLTAMGSAERRSFFEPIVGAENAKDVNALLESKLLLKDQRAGLVTWAKQVAGLKPAAQRDLLSRVQRIDHVLNPAEERAFLSDFVGKRLGADVTPEEAKEISRLANIAQTRRLAIQQDGWTEDTGRLYGRAANDLDEYVNSLKPGPSGKLYWAAQILNVPRTILTSGFLHFSAPLVQARAMITDANWYRGLPQMFRYFGSSEGYQDLMGSIRGHPDYDLLVKKGGLSLTDLSDRLNNREEAIQSSLVEEANKWLSERTGGAVPNMVGANQRAFTGFLNYLRWQTATRLLSAARTAGQDAEAAAPEIATWVNRMTGRANLGSFEGAASLLNSAFFAPRKWVAMIQRLNPVAYAMTKSPVARTFATRQMLGYIASTASILGLAKVAGLQVGLDPRKSDFLNVKIGNIKIDLTDGEASLFRLMSRVFTQSEVNQRGETIPLGYKNAPTGDDLMWRYIRGKLAPVPSLFFDLAAGKDLGGDKATIPHELWKTFGPITVQEFNDYINSSPHDYATILPMLLVPLGLHIQADEGRQLALGDGPAEKEMSRVGLTDWNVLYPTGDQKFDGEVLKQMRPMVDQTIGNFIKSPGYQQMSDARRALVLEAITKKLSHMAVMEAAAQDPTAYAKLQMDKKVGPRLRAVLQETAGPGPSQWGPPPEASAPAETEGAPQ